MFNNDAGGGGPVSPVHHSRYGGNPAVVVDGARDDDSVASDALDGNNSRQHHRHHRHIGGCASGNDTSGMDLLALPETPVSSGAAVPRCGVYVLVPRCEDMVPRLKEAVRLFL